MLTLSNDDRSHRVFVAAPPRRTKRQRKPQAPRPGYDGRFELGVRSVEDPYNPGHKIDVPANVRADLVLRMFSYGEIDEAQFQAGEKFRALLERAGERGAQAIDPSKEPVDGSPKVRDLAADVLDANKELAGCKALLGIDLYRITRGIISDGLNSTLISFATGGRVRRDIVSGGFRRGLELLAIKWGLVSKPEHVNKRANMLAYLSEIAEWTHEERAIDIVYAEKLLPAPRKSRK